MKYPSPILVVFGGPNGSGKSSVKSVLENSGQFNNIENYINPDDIQQHLKCTPLIAAQIADATREYFLLHRESFSFESVLSMPNKLDFMERAKNAEYNVVCIYVLTSNVQININRVKRRAELGGHDVPKEKIISRYKRAMMLIPRLFQVCNELYIYDNSKELIERPIEPIVNFINYQCTSNVKLETFPNSIWSDEMIGRLINGNYFNDTPI